MRHIYTFLGIIVFCLFSTISFGQLTSPTLSPTKDAYIISNSVSSNGGASATLYVGRYADKSCCGYHTRRSTVEFDLSSIPSNAVIVSASFKLNQSTSSGSPVTYVGRLLSSWGESTINWSNQPSYETYDLITSSSVVSGWLTIDVKSHVQKMVAGVYANYGWLLLNNPETATSNVYRNLRSKEDANSSLRPKLEIKYYIPLEVTAAIFSHESIDGADDGSISPTLINGPGGLSYTWYNSTGSVVSSNLNLSGVPYGWYGLAVSSSYISDVFYYAFLVGLDCKEVTIEFQTTPEYTSNAYIMDLVRSGIDYGEYNYGNSNNFITERWTWTNWYTKNSLMKFKLWIDPSIIIYQADLSLEGLDHSTLQGSNAAKLIKVTSAWDENTLTWSISPSTSTSITENINATSSTTEDNVVNLIEFWEAWKIDNLSNFGISFQLQDVSQYYHRQSYHSPNATLTSNRPVITFSVALSNPTSPHYCNQVFAKLERKIKGVKYKPYLEHFYFFYDEEYDVLGAELNYKVYNENDQVTAVMDSNSDPIQDLDYGDNRYALDVGNLATGVYILEITNNKQEKFYLRFII